MSGKGVHVYVTVNDYLARRDAEWMGASYTVFLGLKHRSYSVRIARMEDERRSGIFNADITYGTNNEYGFDYLRDNMAFSRRGTVCRGELNYAIVDEVDSISNR